MEDRERSPAELVSGALLRLAKRAGDVSLSERAL
jgi:hypothetical protein